MKKTALLVAILSCSLLSNGKVFYVSTSGSESNPGTYEQPFASITKAISMMSPGDTTMVRGGTYNLTSTISISKSGNSDNYYTLLAYPEERPVLDFSAQSLGGSNRGFNITASYWRIEGMDVTGAGDNGLKIDGGRNNEIINCAFYRNRDSGVQMGGGASYNRVINCDSYYNADPEDYGDADGFAAKLDVGSNNYFYGCRAWKNCDDGWDGYMRGADNVYTIIEKCWAFEQGYLEDGTDPGSAANGNGFKMGGSDDKTLRHDHLLRHCLAFKNKAKGFDQNNNKGSMTLYNCTGHNNLSANYRIKLELASGEELIVKNCAELGDKVELGDFAIQEANSWLGAVTVTEDDFISTDDSDAYGPRQADGSLPEIDYMRPVETSDLINAGVNVGLSFYGSSPDMGCFEFYEDPGVGIWEEQAGRFSVYPNPAKGDLHIIPTAEVVGQVRISLHDASGRLVVKMEQERYIDGTELVIDLSGLSRGIYLLSMSHEKGVYSKTVVIE